MKIWGKISKSKEANITYIIMHFKEKLFEYLGWKLE